MGTPHPKEPGSTPPFRLTAAGDGMSAVLSILQPPGEGEAGLLFVSIQLALAEAGIKHGIDEASIRNAIQVAANTAQPLENVCIAKGEAGKEGVDGRVVFHFLVDGKDPALVDQERCAGHVAEFDLSKPLARAGDVLATIEAAEPGVDGRTVFGTPVLARAGTAPVLQIGEGVRLREDGCTCVVAPDTFGYANFLNGAICLHNPFRISSDRMEVRMSVHPPSPSGEMLRIEDVSLWLAKNRVVHGILPEAIATALDQAKADGAPVHEVLIAQGELPAAGADARIEYRFERELHAGSFDAQGENFDYHERGFFHRVQKGEVLAEKIPATPGQAGKDVLGNPIAAAAGKDTPLEVAGQVDFSEDGLKCVSTEEGVVVVLPSGAVGVFQEYTIPGDVDFHTGNLDMKGVLIIKGFVREGFKVHATGDIKVDGGIEPAEVTSDAGLTVKRGILGNESVTIRVQGHLVSQFIENARIWTGGDIAVRDGILNSRVTAEGRIAATSGKGHIIGGAICAAGGIEVNELGSKLGVRTFVEVGLDASTRAQLAEMERDCALYDRNQQKITKALAAALRKKEAGRLPPGQQQVLNRLARFHREVELKRRKIENLKKKLEKTATAKLRVRKAVYEGVYVSLLGHRTEVRHDILSPGEFVWNSDENRITYRS